LFICFWDLKEKLTFAFVISASDYVIGVVLGQRKDVFFHVIHYTSKVLNENQVK